MQDFFLATTKSNKTSAKCQPGHFSKDGLSPCQPCDWGNYQPNSGRLSCEPCISEGKLLNTSVKAATHSSQCEYRGYCQRGMLSKPLSFVFLKYKLKYF